jgi:predicted alpha/beta hydrolase
MEKSSPSTLVDIACADGYTLHGTLWEGAQAPIALVLVHPATAVPEALYAGFASYLLSRGFAALTYDYRGIGRSKPATLRGFSARMRDWADLDVEAVGAWARARFPDLPMLAVGHSMGGHAIGLTEASAQLTAAVLIASHAGSLRFITDRRERLRATLLLKFVGPLLCRILGYMPARALGLGEDYPAGVIHDWSRWTSMHRYFFDDSTMRAAERFARQRMPVLSVGMDDDPWGTPAGVDLLAAHLVNCAVERRQYSPAMAGAPIGHIGYFRRQHRDKLWAPVVDWLEAAVRAAPAGKHVHPQVQSA